MTILARLRSLFACPGCEARDRNIAWMETFIGSMSDIRRDPVAPYVAPRADTIPRPVDTQAQEAWEKTIDTYPHYRSPLTVEMVDPRRADDES